MPWSALVTTSSETGAPYRHFDAMPLGLGVIRDGRCVYANASMLHLLGRTAAQVVGQLVEDLLKRYPDGEALIERHARRMRGERVPAVYEFPVSTPEGERRVEASITVEGQEAVVLLRDVSARARHRS